MAGLMAWPGFVSHMPAAAKTKATKSPLARVFAYKFSKIYPLYVQKAERKNRTQKEVDQIICWLTGYTAAGLQKQIKGENDLEAFFAQAPSSRGIASTT